MKSFSTYHTPRSHIPKFESKLPKIDFFYIFSDSLVLAEKSFWKLYKYFGRYNNIIWVPVGH